MVVLSLDGDSAGHLAVALIALAARKRKQGGAFPATLVALQAAAENVIQTGQPMRLTITSPQEHSISGDRSESVQDDLHEREFLTRSDVASIASVGIATVDRWIANDQLPSHKIGRTRRIRRSDFDRFFSRAA
jgi:excisionase family DNA binding protein